MTDSKRRITDIFEEKVFVRKERNEFVEWGNVEKVLHRKRPVDALSPLQRLAHHFVDSIILTLIQIPITIYSLGRRSIILDLLPILFFLAYYVVCECYFQRTIGKLTTDSIVVNEYGEKPDFKTVCLRTIIRIVPFDPFSIFWVGGDRLWHDTWTKTYVISKTELVTINKIMSGEKPKKGEDARREDWHNWK
jgi:uncharacterized RDD family membrane protein YckC